MRIRNGLWLVLLLLIGLPVAWAQYSETTGAIRGTVKDPTGAVVPGAEVEISGPTLIASMKVTTDGAGAYRFAFLPPGQYKITVTASGFRRAEQVGIQLDVGKELPIDFALEVGQVTQTVEVTAAPLIIDTSSSKADVNLSAQVISEIPKGRSFQDMINYAPGSRMEPLQSVGAGTTGYQIDGASDGENAYLVEGMDTTHIQTGGSGVNVPIEFIQEVQVKSSGFEAEYGGALGGVVTVITKRGSNTWHGSGLMYYRANKLEGTPRPGLRGNPEDLVDYDIRLAERPEYYKYKADNWRTIEPGFELGGPVKQDKLWFYGSYIPSLYKTERTVKFDDPYGTKTFTQTDRTHFGLARVDFAPSEKIRTAFNWDYAYRRWTGGLPTADSQWGQINGDAGSDPANWPANYGASLPNSTYVASAYFTPSAKILASVRWGYWFTDAQDRGKPTGNRYQYMRSSIGFAGLDGTPVPEAFQQRSGFMTLPDVRQTVFDYRTRMGLAGDFSYIFHGGGTHTLKAGYAMNRLHNNVDYEPFTFWMRPYWGYDYPPILEQGDENCAAIRAANVANGYGDVCRGNFGVYRIVDFSTIGNVASFNHSLYVQDRWQVSRRVTLNLGIRFDKEYLPSFSTAANIPSKAINFGFTDKVAPRLGGAVDVFGDGKLKLYGSWGLFYDIMKYELPRGSFGGDYWHDCWYTLDTYDYTTITPIKDANNHTCPGGTYPGTFIEEIDWRIPSNDPSNYNLEPNLKPMRQREMVLGGEYALRSDMGLEIRYARKRLDRTIEDIGVLGTGGESYLIGNPGFGKAREVTAGVCPDCPIPKAIRNYDGLEFRLIKRWSHNWFMNASYTYSRLWGNYSGLTSTDESGRHSPNVNRFFDLPNMSFDAHGQLQQGFLPTNRPHTFKFYGSRRLRWKGMETTFGLIQFAYSGSPITTEINVISSTPVMVENADNFMPVTRDAATGNWVAGTLKKGFRTPAFTNTDFLFVHEFKLSKTNEALRATFEVNISNLFNEKNTLRVDYNPLRDGQINIDWTDFFQGFDWIQYSNDQGLVFNNNYGYGNLFQSPRSLRLKFMFSF